MDNRKSYTEKEISDLKNTLKSMKQCTPKKQKKSAYAVIVALEDDINELIGLGFSLDEIYQRLQKQEFDITLKTFKSYWKKININPKPQTNSSKSIQEEKSPFTFSSRTKTDFVQDIPDNEL
ncbi:hypothetical protein [Zooshikella harenae]|uniref:Conjugal transfer protein TraD n=1 Tax=Zooshikella harenae TaxID=2827238 RepID=A0ABS5ZEK3_9GAMM|nr:hypothetical protein [Zooshikella harenae]MBU2711690.1 hypothetical protein [Zooshikella harenae]